MKDLLIHRAFSEGRWVNFSWNFIKLLVSTYFPIQPHTKDTQWYWTILMHFCTAWNMQSKHCMYKLHLGLQITNIKQNFQNWNYEFVWLSKPRTIQMNPNSTDKGWKQYKHCWGFPSPFQQDWWNSPQGWRNCPSILETSSSKLKTRTVS